METYFDAHVEGRGIWKWRHYLRVYERLLEPFVDREIHLVEVGIYSGGSLEMWRQYLGPDCRVYGVDIDPACRAYEDLPGVRVFIGDQADTDFWQAFLREVPSIDAVIDDGGHLPREQITTFEALFPRIRPGGFYACEDIHNPIHPFHAYLDGFARRLHTMGEIPFHQQVASVQLYPYLTVIEKPRAPVKLELVRRGTEWRPSYD